MFFTNESCAWSRSNTETNRKNFFYTKKKTWLRDEGIFFEECQIEDDDGVKHNWNRIAILDS